MFGFWVNRDGFTPCCWRCVLPFALIGTLYPDGRYGALIKSSKIVYLFKERSRACLRRGDKYDSRGFTDRFCSFVVSGACSVYRVRIPCASKKVTRDAAIVCSCGKDT